MHHHTTCLMRKNLSSPALARAARKTYFKVIQTAKRVHWSHCRANVDSQSVWDAQRLLPAEPRIVFLCLRMPPLPLKLTIHFYNISSLLGPLLLLLSSFLRLRTTPWFHQRMCPPHFKNPATRQLLGLTESLAFPY